MRPGFEAPPTSTALVRLQASLWSDESKSPSTSRWIATSSLRWAWREALRSSFDDRVAKHAEEVEARLWQEGEADAGRTLLWGALGGPDGDTLVARPLRELLSETETEEEIADR